MSERIEYELSDEEFHTLMAASQPTPVMFLSGGRPMFDSPQENANRAWAELGKKRGFDHFTVQAVAGKSERFFTACPLGDKP